MSTTKRVVKIVHALNLLQPAEPTDSETTIYLTNIDHMLLVPVESFFVYTVNPERSSEGVFAELEQAPQKLLVPYHFMAARFAIVEEEPGQHPGRTRVHVKCNRAGARYVVASSEQSVEELGDLKLMNLEFQKLVPAPEDDGLVHSLVDDFLFMVQVTRFKCRGFIVGFRMSHAMCDGTSSTQFFSSFCQIARRERLTCFPDLDRTILKPRYPPSPECGYYR